MPLDTKKFPNLSGVLPAYQPPQEDPRQPQETLTSPGVSILGIPPTQAPGMAGFWQPPTPTPMPEAPPRPETGGWIQFGEGFAGGPERFELPKAPAPEVDPRQEFMLALKANPGGMLSQLELKMGQRGMHEGQRAAHRATIAEMMDVVGLDPGASLLYAQGGAQALPQVASMLSRQAQAQAEEFATTRRFNLSLAARSGQTLPASTQKMILDLSLSEATTAKQRAVVVLLPNGEVRIKPVKKTFRSEKVAIEYTEKAFAAYLKGKELPKDIMLVDLTGGGGISKPSRPTAPSAPPTAPGGPQATEDDYSGVVNMVNRRRGR